MTVYGVPLLLGNCWLSILIPFVSQAVDDGQQSSEIQELGVL